MAYPFVHFPTFAEFITRLTSKEFACSFETVPAPMVVNGNDEDCVSIHFLKRTVSNETRTYAIYIDDFEARMEPSIIRSICTRLEVPTETFGLTLG